MPRFVTRAVMDDVSKEIYPLLPAQFRDQLPVEAKASAQNSEIFRATLQVMPRLVNELFAQVKYTNGVCLLDQHLAALNKRGRVCLKPLLRSPQPPKHAAFRLPVPAF